MLGFMVSIISILSAFSLFVPVFSGYLLALMMVMLSVVDYFRVKSTADIEYKQSFHQKTAFIKRALIVLAVLCGCSSLYVYSTESINSKQMIRAYIDFLVKNLIVWFAYGSFWWRFAAEPSLRRNFSVTLASCAFVNLVYCVIQRFYGVDWGQGFHSVLPITRFSDGVYRVSGFMGHPLTLGYCQTLMAIAVIGMSLSAKLRWEKIAWALAGIAASLVVLISGSRGPQLALAAGLLGLTSVQQWRRQWRVLGLIVFIGILLAVKVGLFARFMELSNANLGGDMRFTHWAVYWRLFTENLFFGFGVGGRDAAISAYYLAFGASDKIRSAHNALLQYAADFGLVGLAGWLTLFGSWLRFALTAKHVGKACRSMLMVTLIGAVTQNNLQDSEYVLAFTVWFMFFVTREVDLSEFCAARGTKTKNRLSREGGSTA